eukprot:13420588-Alexandrium_andersonii.AAC.1
MSTPHASTQQCCETVGTCTFVSEGSLPSRRRSIAGLRLDLRELAAAPTCVGKAALLPKRGTTAR